jgi:hypothetical protein
MNTITLQPPYKLEQLPIFTVNSPLLKYSRNVASQNGEDGIIEHIFSRLPAATKRHFVEFGAWDGKHLSNCFNLANNPGWNGLFIEANEGKFEQLILNHGRSENITCLNRFVEFEGPNRLDNLIDQTRFPIDFDLLSIDIDGPDYFVWESMEEFRPKVVIIEFNPSIPNDVVFVQAKDMTVNQGSSLLALILLGKKKGYELICATSCNAIFVLSEFYEAFGLESNHITQLYTPHCDGRIFHGYDSYVYITGMPRLLWSNVDISSHDLQVLPKSLRKFRDAQTS